MNDDVAALRNAFDRAFAAPPAEAAEVLESLIAIRVSGEPYALRVADIVGIAKDRKIVTLPTDVPQLMGLAGIRGALVPVYSLAALLGYGGGGEAASWLALCGKDEPVALAFDELEAYVRVPSSEVYSAGQAGLDREHVEEATRIAGVPRPVLGIPSMMARIRSLIGDRRSTRGTNS